MQTPDTQRESHSEGDYDAMISLWMLHYGFSIAVRAPLALVLTAIWISLAARYDLWQISALLFIEGVHWQVLEVFTMEIRKKKMWRGTFEVVLFRLYIFFFFNNVFFFFGFFFLVSSYPNQFFFNGIILCFLGKVVSLHCSIWRIIPLAMIVKPC